ncbi:hypothetical protein Cadr_000006346 [Camelus dromedarius]|uniref:Uncharacterized protein n=1 Tax=Camelus dromedarius TaxID=9838 RepID=A0A5N4E0Y8_CAMDR|nr:hypothetical protein Cadr_000006346 [Camelus dromedarius]
MRSCDSFWPTDCKSMCQESLTVFFTCCIRSKRPCLHGGPPETACVPEPLLKTRCPGGPSEPQWTLHDIAWPVLTNTACLLWGPEASFINCAVGDLGLSPTEHTLTGQLMDTKGTGSAHCKPECS